ncbi:Nitroimidazol reductase NimA, pyridoxamine 5'-phosphate oxidase superfamily [Micromonospora echinaurantiaca]|uniref:Nitroimidazol reductase NimA, pyridoxamine 5'-phosphate oxidase superfamily n=1 Tax=Micromonospora echinaurantiaca TaxID=47857 RepID=A0A1C5IGH5_9ACTN|nr:pyridoxamine 5'-phosphate oxidase family protein [Micromonospora echinaurantiaca]SCG57173.1 Nitroimidazol reductase NimA, pyridoxamine 5'-phosphate oxidase superfamily [Micromonospora echinaurantiaca]
MEPSASDPLTSAGPPTSWANARAQLAAADTYWLVTIGKDNIPHVVPVLAVWHDYALHFAANNKSRKARNLALNPRCTLSTNAESLDMVVEGRAIRVVEAVKLRQVAHEYSAKYDWHVTVRDSAFHDTEGAPTAGPPPYDVYAVKPAIVYGFQTTASFNSTRWRFD